MTSIPHWARNNRVHGAIYRHTPKTAITRIVLSQVIFWLISFTLSQIASLFHSPTVFLLFEVGNLSVMNGFRSSLITAMFMLNSFIAYLK